MTHIVVTGATGLVGRAVVRCLESRRLSHDAWGSARCDLRSATSLHAAFDASRTTHVLHLAARGVAPRDARHPAVAVDNVAMAAAWLEVLEERSTRMLAAGTMAEYGPNVPPRIPETAGCAPTNAYGIGKLAATQLLLTREQTSVARLFGVYGRGEAPHRLFPAIFRAAETKQALPMSDGAQVRDFIHVDDVAEILLDLLLAAESPRLVNVGSGVGVSVRDVSERMMLAAGGELSLLQFGARPRNATDADRLVADTTVLERFLGRSVADRLQASDLGALVADLRGSP